MSEITTTAPPPPTDEELEDNLQIQVVDLSHGAIGNAVDNAQEFIDEQTTQTGVRGFIKRIWYGNPARDYVRLREIGKGRDQIVAENNVHALDGGTQADHDSTASAVVERFSSEYMRSDEVNKDMADVENGAELQTSLQSLIKDFANGTIDHDALVEEKTRLLAEYGTKVHKEDRNKGLLFADNVVEVALNARTAFEHGVALDRIDSLLSSKAGEARMGASTEANQQVTDRVLDKLYSTKAGSLVNETTLALAAGVAISVGKFVTNKAATAAGAFLGMGVGVGVVAGLRARLKVGQERTSHLRERAVGGEAPEVGSKKREKLEATRYDTVRAEDVLGSLQAAREVLGTASPADLQQAVADIRMAQARVQLSDDKKIDLIQWSSKLVLEDERLAIATSLADSKAALTRALEGISDEDLEMAGLSSRDANEIINDHTDQVAELTGDITEKDQAFNKLRRNQTMMMATCGFVGSVAVGTAIQELKANMSSDLQGVFESNGDGQQRRTLLAGIFRDHQANTSGDLIGATDHANVLTEQAHAKLPPDYQLAPGSDGNWQLLDANGNSVSDNLTLDSNGHLSEASHDALTNKGFNLSEATETYETTSTVTETVPRTPEEYINSHPDEFTEVRRGWYDNDTQGVFDLNEQKLHWGGQNGIDADGNYVFNVQSMTPDGSFHDGLSADAQQLVSEGKMTIALSMDVGSQSQVFMVPIDSSGNAIIDRNSFIGQSLFENRDGQAHFIGGYAEAAQILDVGADGKTNINMLATVVGENNPGSGQDTITNIVTEQHERIITTIEAPVLQDVPVEVPFVMPVYGRRGLEKLPTRQERIDYNRGYDRYGPQSQEEIDELIQDVIPALRTDPRARIPTADATEWYERRLGEQYGSEYVSELKAVVASSPELSTLDNGTKAIITIPVEAITEGDNVFNTLSLYGQLSEDEQAETVILLHTNWITSRATTPEALAGIQHTNDEIKRAKAAYPGLRITSIESQWSDEQISEGNGVIGYVARRMYDVAIIATGEAINGGAMEADHEVVIIRNDIDAKGISQSYITNMVNATTQDDKDVAVGRLKWGIEQTGSLPGLIIATKFIEGIKGSASRAAAKGIDVGIQSSGANTGVRLSTLAAVGSIGFADYTGAGSDDLPIGNRISAVRRSTSPTNRAMYRQTNGGRLRGWVSRKPQTTGYTQIAGDDDDSTIGIATGATIDTDVSRLEAKYRAGESIAGAWNDFNDEGFKQRSAGMPAISDKESLEDDLDGVIANIEFQINSSIEGWRVDPLHAEMELRRLFPSNKPGEEPMYETTNAPDGSLVIKFTDSGKKLLSKRLTRNNRGQFDPIASRRKRVNYRRSTPRRSFPTNRTARLIGAA